MLKNKILLSHGYLPWCPPATERTLANIVGSMSSMVRYATISSNLAHFGFVLPQEAQKVLANGHLDAWWPEIDSALKELTGVSRKMGDAVVYKNFPKEVLDMTQAEYWTNQILMYWHVLDAQDVAKAPVKRSKLLENPKLKVLKVCPTLPFEQLVLVTIQSKLHKATSRWTDDEREEAKFFWGTIERTSAVKIPDPELFGFMENMIDAYKMLFDIGHGPHLRLKNATNCMRMAAAFSGINVSLRELGKFKLNKPQQKFLLREMDSYEVKALEDDFAMRPEQWKRLLSILHPMQYKEPGLGNPHHRYNNVVQAYANLYQDRVKSFNSNVEKAIFHKDAEVLDILGERPGELVRRWHKMVSMFGYEGVNAQLKENIHKLTTHQLIKLHKYVLTANKRKTFMVPPKGNWNKAQIVSNNKLELSAGTIMSTNILLNNELNARLRLEFPEGVQLDENLVDLKLPTNDNMLAPYGRGTKFKIPEEVNFIRTASYWECKTGRTNWFDNGWNFFDENWTDKGSCCWNTVKFPAPNYDDPPDAIVGAAFSGDPVNMGKNAACQMIDLYLDKLVAAGVRYAVWNVLCFSMIKFADAEDVFGCLQWGENAQKGELFEPSRCQMAFPLKANGLTSYVAYIDLETRELVYMDAPLNGNVRSASSNGGKLAVNMPAYVEYLHSLPSVFDLMLHCDNGYTKFLYDDTGVELKNDEEAFVFRPSNPDNKYINLREKLNAILAAKGSDGN